MIQEIQPTLIAVKKDTAKLEDEIKDLVIENDADAASASEILARVKTRSKKLEEKRKEYVDPLNKQVKLINNDFKLASAPYIEIERVIRMKLGAYLDNKRKAELAAAAKLEEARQKEAAKIAKKHDISQEEAVSLMPEQKKEEAPTPMVSQSGAVGSKVVWKFDIVDEVKVPVEYKIVDSSAIRKAVAAGAREIPGVKIYEEVQTVVHTNR